jgi:hypothetical protein
VSKLLGSLNVPAAWDGFGYKDAVTKLSSVKVHGRRIGAGLSIATIALRG